MKAKFVDASVDPLDLLDRFELEADLNYSQSF